jgi:hypothetical protein
LEETATTEALRKNGGTEKVFLGVSVKRPLTILFSVSVVAREEKKWRN